ncbi:DNA polymerase III subunit alpha [Malacoplasma penetrans]|uniref:DNA-directed DNA polymerase n=1 Tax=Malacoplasma penetrans (strain HF-2) TaxID=272633 RepID=Q8EWK5_MALP2|nr:DNA polymerase III subunit alpha [Malacoplasma penetrans]RXY96137.1 DNA polymerase III subunit alpha [Malacoplasma penetrans]BAC43989.1 DNA polymerase III subunit alpha [Malacoplasma penetrans HF-2]
MKEKNKNNLTPLVLNLNTYSHYSLLSSSLSLDQIIEFAINEEKKYVCLTDTNLYGVIEFYLKCKDKNLMPVIGLSINSQLIENTKYDFVLFAKNKKGYLNLVKISSFLMTNNDFNYENYLSDLFIVDKNGTFDFKTDSKVYSINPKDKNAIAFNEARYFNKNDKRVFNALQAIKNNRTVSIDELEEGQDLSLLTESESVSLFNDVQIENLNNEIKEVNLEIEFEKNNIIKYPNESNLSDKALLHKFCMDGLNEKIFNKEIDSNSKDTYIERMEYELQIIDDMGFNDYFLVVQDFINDAKNKGILIGPGRGSAAGSLIAYLLGITEIDSIKYNLLFERFLNPGRITMPDIDIDIMDIRRDEVVEYLFEKYGYDHVAHIITFQKIKAKMALRDIGRILNIDLKIINSICKSITKDLEEDLANAINTKKLQDAYKSYKDLFDLAIGIMGCPRQVGIHAAGVVLSQKVLTDIVPIQTSVNGEITTQYSMDYLEDLGLIKMDLLGLTNLSTINHVCKLIKMNHGIEINLAKLNLEDQNVFLDLQQGHTLGIFQLESEGMTSVVKQVKPVCIEDISICSALFRPGPMQNIKPFVRRREGFEKVEYIDVKNKDILEPTHGIIVYQEQVINLVRRIANFSLSEADMFRRIISKKKGHELDNFKKMFFENALKNDYTQDRLEQIYNYIYTFADYGFNHSHSVAYSLIGYWMAYLKHYYPIEFMIILMTFSENDKNKIDLYVNECKRLNINIRKPDINISNKSFGLYKKNTILFGLNSIKGIGVETSKKIIEIRTNNKDKKFSDFCEAIKKLSSNKVGISTLETLINAGTFDGFKLSKKYMLENLPIIVDAASNLKDDGSFLFEPRLIDVEGETNAEKEAFNKKEIELLGLDLNEDNNNFSDKNELLYKYPDIKPITEPITNGTFKSIVFIKSYEIKKTKKNTDMLSLMLVDIFNNKKKVISFSSHLISNIDSLDFSKKYLGTFRGTTFGPNLTFLDEVE